MPPTLQGSQDAVRNEGSAGPEVDCDAWLLLGLVGAFTPRTPERGWPPTRQACAMAAGLARALTTLVLYAASPFGLCVRATCRAGSFQHFTRDYAPKLALLPPQILKVHIPSFPASKYQKECTSPYGQVVCGASKVLADPYYLTAEWVVCLASRVLLPCGAFLQNPALHILTDRTSNPVVSGVLDAFGVGKERRLSYNPAVLYSADRLYVPVATEYDSQVRAIVIIKR
eukprot:1196403-Prorocentrum_minimum.AAC.3